MSSGDFFNHRFKKKKRPIINILNALLLSVTAPSGAIMGYHLYTVLYFITEVFFKQVLFPHELSKAFSVHFYVMA